MAVMVLPDKHQNIININLYLLDKFNLKDNIIRNISAFSLRSFFLPLIPKVLILPKIILQVPLANNLFPCKIVKRQKQVSHAK